MNISRALEVLEEHHKWFFCRGSAALGKNSEETSNALEVLLATVKVMKITDESPIVGGRYRQLNGGVLGEVKVIGFGGGYVIYRRKGNGALLCGCKDFLKNFELIGGNGG